jgi:hypothetical protein
MQFFAASSAMSRIGDAFGLDVGSAAAMRRRDPTSKSKRAIGASHPIELPGRGNVWPVQNLVKA